MFENVDGRTDDGCPSYLYYFLSSRNKFCYILITLVQRPGGSIFAWLKVNLTISVQVTCSSVVYASLPIGRTRLAVGNSHLRSSPSKFFCLRDAITDCTISARKLTAVGQSPRPATDSQPSTPSSTFRSGLAI